MKIKKNVEVTFIMWGKKRLLGRISIKNKNKETKMSKKFRLQCISLIILMVAISINVFSMIYANNGDCAFKSGCDEGGEGGESTFYLPSSGGIMGMYIVEGAGYLLDARAGVSTFMSKFETTELTGADFVGMRDTLSKVIEKMEMANANFAFINYIAATSQYRESVIERLKTFDYDDFQKRWGLYPTVFDRVKGFLAVGDVRGVFSEISTDIGLLLERLYTLKAVLNADQFPSVQSVWQFNQAFSENIFFGQYMAMVMTEAK